MIIIIALVREKQRERERRHQFLLGGREFHQHRLYFFLFVSQKFPKNMVEFVKKCQENTH